MLTPKQLKSMSPRELKRAMATRATVVVQYQRETQQLKREIEKRSPREVHFRIEMDENSYPGSCFETVDSPCRRHPDGQRHRIHPRETQKQTRYPQDLCADEIEAWMTREGITHVVSESEDTETSPESLASGRYTRARFIKWWRLLEEDDCDEDQHRVRVPRGNAVIVGTDEVKGKRIEIHADRFGARRYWAMVDGCALFQRGRMRLRMFTTANAARKAALEEALP